jgi:hypothetical protein
MMDAQQFAMWLHGYLEISDPKEIGEKETQIIKDHLNLLFDKKTPDRTQELTRKDLQVPIIADPKMSPGEIKIVPHQQHGLFCTCIICEAGRQMIPRGPLEKRCKCAPGAFCACNLVVTC